LIGRLGYASLASATGCDPTIIAIAPITPSAARRPVLPVLFMMSPWFLRGFQGFRTLLSAWRRAMQATVGTGRQTVQYCFAP